MHGPAGAESQSNKTSRAAHLPIWRACLNSRRPMPERRNIMHQSSSASLPGRRTQRSSQIRRASPCRWISPAHGSEACQMMCFVGLGAGRSFLNEGAYLGVRPGIELTVSPTKKGHSTPPRSHRPPFTRSQLPHGGCKRFTLQHASRPTVHAQKGKVLHITGCMGCESLLSKV